MELLKWIPLGDGLMEKVIKDVHIFIMPLLKAAEILGCDSSGINRACKENNNINIANTKYKGKYKGFRWFYL